MLLSDYQFPFDPELIAKHPIHPRDAARLLLLSRSSGEITDRIIKDLPDILRPGDMLVFNDTKVIPARMWGTKVPTGGRVEIMFVKEKAENVIEVLVKGRVEVGQILACPGHTEARVLSKDSGCITLEWRGPGSFQDTLGQYGEVPLPPYLKRAPTDRDTEDYQTVFAKVDGAIAAPTAGLHFTESLFKTLTAQGIEVGMITLHVGPGTFQPVKVTDVERHHMHPEWASVSTETANRIRAVRRQKGRIIAVGTTVARTLESALDANGEIIAWSGETRLFILPGFTFQVVDGLLTNFHFPETTLLMLVSAFAGLEVVREAYAHAVRERYRLYSYGDAMLIQ